MIFIILLSVIAIWLIIGYITFRIFLLRSMGKKRRSPRALRNDQAPAAFKMDREWLTELMSETWTIRSRDGLHLNARFLPGSIQSLYAICCHGYRANSASSAAFAHVFYELGFSVLLPDARAHGKSEGRFIGMGYPERLDILDWAESIIARDPAAKIVLFGVSMGGATVMNTVGETLPENIVGAIEDCGYISAREIFQHQLRMRHLPGFLLYSAAPYARLFAGFSALSRTVTRVSLRNSCIPILMIHGDADHFVPIDHMYEAAASGGKNAQTVVIPDAKHAGCIITDPLRYKSAVIEFVRQFI